MSRPFHNPVWPAVFLNCLAKDMKDREVDGGEISLATVGLNVYPNSRLKIMVDYGFGRVDHGERAGDIRSLGARVQYEF